VQQINYFLSSLLVVFSLGLGLSTEQVASNERLTFRGKIELVEETSYHVLSVPAAYSNFCKSAIGASNIWLLHKSFLDTRIADLGLSKARLVPCSYLIKVFLYSSQHSRELPA